MNVRNVPFVYMKHAISKTRTEILDEHLRIATICIKPDIDQLLSKKTSSMFSLKIFRVS